MILYLMRHGETDYNKARYFYGSSDVSLNDKGQQQAQAMARVMAKYPVNQIYTSSLKRTQETAQLVFSDQVDHIVPLSGFDEKDFGAWEGLRAEDIEALFPNDWAAWLEDPFGVTPPAAEAFAHFKERVINTLASLLAEKDSQEPVAIVGHLGVLRLIYQYLVDKEAVFWDIDFPQGTVTRFVLSATNGWEAQLVNEEGENHDAITN